MGILLALWEHPVEIYEYEVLADNILADGEYKIRYMETWYRSFGSPPFAYLCAFVYAISGHSHHGMLIVQALLSMLTVWACYSIGRQLFSPAVGAAAGMLVAFHPGLIYFDTHKIHPLGFDASLAALGAYTCVVLGKRVSPGTAVVSGLGHALALFERSTFVGLMVFALYAIRRSAKPGDFIKLASIYLAVLAMTLLPWMARNILIYNSPVFISTTSGEIFWRGNNPLASGGAYAEGQPGIGMFDVAPKEFQRHVLEQSELVQNRIFWQTAMTFVGENPSKALTLYVKKLIAFWWFSPHAGFLYPPMYLLIYKAYYVGIVVPALVGFGVAYRRGMADGQLWVGAAAFVITVSLLQAAFYVDGRHRWGVEPLMLIFTGLGLVSIGTTLFGLRASESS